MKITFIGRVLAFTFISVLVAFGDSSAYVRKTDTGLFGRAMAVNQSGQAAGEFFSNGVTHAYFWSNGSLTDLGTFGGARSEARDISETGKVVGNCDTSMQNGYLHHAFLWASGTMTDLGTLGGDSSFAYYVNEAGTVVGGSEVTSGTGYHAFVWKDGVINDIGTLGGSETLPYCLNEADQVVGSSWVSGSYYSAFIWSDGTMTNLGHLGGYYSQAHSINEAGQVVGFSFYGPISTTQRHAFILNPLDTDYDDVPDTWYKDDDYNGRNDLMTDIGTLGGAMSWAKDINESGQVTGHSTTSSGATHAFLWDNGVMTDLGTLGGSDSEAYKINSSGQIIGRAQTASGDWHAFVWDNGEMVDLGTLGGQTSWPYDITDNGKIAGQADTAAQGTYNSVIWEVLHGQQVGIDVIPYDATNSIDMSRARTVPVAILSTPSFDATTVSPATVEMNSAKVKQKKNGAYTYTIEDVNYDGIMDLVCEIDAAQLSLPAGTSNVELYGVTGGGVAVEGAGTINNTQ